nr:carbohydrate binding domain-containing protein [uncultured Flavobacterium sp.]
MKTKLLLMFLFLTITLQAQTNLVPNGDFENWTSSSQPDKWFRSFSGLVFQSTSAQNGSSSTKMQITSGTLNFINSEFFPVVAGKTYRITMYHKLVTGTFSAIELSLYHQPGTFKEEIAKKTTAVTSSTEWRKLEFDYTPTVSESIEVDIWTTGTLNSEILVDNVSVVDAANLGPLYTSIPDLNFEKKLIALGHDSGTPDGKVLTSNIKAVTSLTLDATTIADLTGIEDFVALKTLICSGNSGSLNGGNGLLTKIDVSNNSVLTSLHISYNKIKSIDISKNVLLTYLNVSVNGMTGLDVSNNVALTNLDCSTNQLTTLDISKNVALTTLYCSSNQLTTLDLSKNVALSNFNCSYNKLTTLDLSKNVALTRLYCWRNQLTTLDLSKNVALSNFNCSYSAGALKYYFNYQKYYIVVH